MTEPSRAVFLSYASQDAEAAQRIAEALRAAGMEVWFDQSELRGGDAWDQMIRKQIKACALFIPVISRHTHERREGYFRLEWNLALDRSRLISTTQAFLVPVVIDDTHEDDEEVPEKIRDVHWTRLPGGNTSPAFVERIKRLLSGEVAQASGSAVPSIPPASHRFIRRRKAVLYGAIAVVATLALGFSTLERLNRTKPIAPGSASIAVLPLANESGDAGQQYFSDGLSEDLITALSQFPGLRVIGRASSFQFRDSKDDSKTIGTRLGVAHLLEGSVRRAGDVVRVSVELINAADSSTLWSERYDRPYKDLFALQDDITSAVARALKTTLLSDRNQATQNDRPPSGNLDAYNALLQGRFHYLRRTEGDFRKAIDYFTAATQLDPKYALAWSSRSIALSVMADEFLVGTSWQQASAEALASADTALALAPDLSDAHVAQGLGLLKHFDWRGAEGEFRRALQLAPNDGRAHYNLGVMLATLGQLQSAIDLTRQALVADPLHADWYVGLGNNLSALGQLDEAERAIRKGIELQPSGHNFYATLASVQVLRGDPVAALTAAEQEPPGDSRDFAVALARQIGSDRTAADAALQTAIDRYADHDAYLIAQVYALRHDADKTFEWLDRAWTNRDPSLTSLLSDPFILRYKDDPRFAAFCRKVGLPVPGQASADKST